MSKISEQEFQQLESELTVTETLNCSRLLCPMPVIKTQNKLKELAEGDILKVICTDPGTMADIPTWSRINEIEVLGYSELSDHSIEFLLRK
ncbi:MAG: sulfurtransferase TusA family protein [Gammaproteobacteria bacterium]|nr:sulfurtransferase TusA family protein [Gammaproteobacteria bacterium]